MRNTLKLDASERSQSSKVINALISEPKLLNAIVISRLSRPRELKCSVRSTT
jgi:hypothetical protein